MVLKLEPSLNSEFLRRPTERPKRGNLQGIRKKKEYEESLKLQLSSFLGCFTLHSRRIVKMRWSAVVCSFVLSSVPAKAVAASSASSSSTCRCFPGDRCWPSAATWANFNQSVDGTLIATVPLGTPCHAPSYNATECNVLRNGWLLPEEQ